MNKLEDIDTEKRWKVKAHYVAGEFAGYVIVTDDKYENVICHGLGVDQEAEADLIASAPELKAERDRLRKSLEEISESDIGVDEGGSSCYICEHTINIAKKALQQRRK